MGIEDPPRPADLPPGYDEDPYADEDVSEYPEWWQQNIHEFREHSMRPYRPPRFTDGAYTPEVIERLETEFDVDILIRAVEPRVGNDWHVTIDGSDVATIGRHRSGDGFTVYELPSTEFERTIRHAID